MKVKVTKMGFHNNKRVREGAVIELLPIKGKKMNDNGILVDHTFSPEEQFSSKWMLNLEVSEDTEAKAPAAKSFGKKKTINVAEALDVI